MSGGYFGYKQHYINDIADEIARIPGENLKNEYEEDYSRETIARFKEAVVLLRKAAIYTQRIDWLLSGDDGEESFHEQLNEELKELNHEEE